MFYRFLLFYISYTHSWLYIKLKRMTSSSKEIGWRGGGIPKKSNYLGEWNCILTSNDDITFSGPVSLWNVLQEKVEIISDKHCSIRWFEAKAYYVVVQEKGFFDDLKVVLVPEWHAFILFIVVSFSAVRDWTYIFFYDREEETFWRRTIVSYLQFAEVWHEGKNFTLFLIIYVIRDFF